MIYLDASGLITLVTRRLHAADIDDFLESRPGLPTVTSTIGFIETVRNCDRMGSYPNLMSRLLRDYTEVQVTAEIRDRAASLPGSLKALDAIHVATAETLGEDLIALVTYDRTMANVARSMGLPVASPGVADT